MTPINEAYTLEFDSLVRLARLYNNALMEFARTRGHAACDIADGLPPSHAAFYGEVHFNAAGAKRVAALIDACIRPLVRSLAAARQSR